MFLLHIVQFDQPNATQIFISLSIQSSKRLGSNFMDLSNSNKKFHSLFIIWFHMPILWTLVVHFFTKFSHLCVLILTSFPWKAKRQPLEFLIYLDKIY